MISNHPLSETISSSWSPALGSPIVVRPTILIAEDDDNLAHSLLIRLGRVYDVRIESTGRGAFASYRAELPNVLLLDYQLPDTNGIRLLQSITRNFGAQTPAILMTAYSSRERASLDAGFYRYIQKPFCGAELMSMIEWALDLDPRTT
jgi:two-component system phosphate regulon response regulator PhoB